MKTSDRIALYESVIDLLLTRARDGGYVVFERAGRPDEYVQYKLHGGSVYGEVGSRQWTEPECPLPATAVEALGRLGFVGGGPERNYAKDELPRSVHDLATLTDTLLRSAYALDDEFSPIVRELNLNDVALPRAEPFSREMIAAHLRDHDIRFLRDEDGDFRVDIRGEGGEVATVWLVAEGPDEGVYRISNCAHHLPATRVEALERCNEWNREHRWPKAFVVDEEAGWRLFLCADLDLGLGVTRTLFDTFTQHVVTGMLEFWAWMASKDAATGGDRGRRRRRPRGSDG